MERERQRESEIDRKRERERDRERKKDRESFLDTVISHGTTGIRPETNQVCHICIRGGDQVDLIII